MSTAEQNTPETNENFPVSGFVTAAQVCKFYNFSRSKLYADVKNGKLPKPYKFGHRTARFKAEEIRAITVKMRS